MSKQWSWYSYSVPQICFNLVLLALMVQTLAKETAKHGKPNEKPVQISIPREKSASSPTQIDLKKTGSKPVRGKSDGPEGLNTGDSTTGDNKHHPKPGAAPAAQEGPGHPPKPGAAAAVPGAKLSPVAAQDPDRVIDDASAIQNPNAALMPKSGLPPRIVTDTLIVPVVLCNCDENEITGPGEPGPGPQPPPPPPPVVMTTTTKPGISTTAKIPGTTNPTKPGPKAEIVFAIDRSSNTVLQKYEAVVSELLAHFQKFFKHESKYGATTFADFSKDEFGANYTNSWAGKHPHHNDPQGCYKLQQPLTSDAAKITEMTSKDKIPHLGTHTDGGTGSILTAMMVSAVDKKLGWTKGKQPSLKKLLVVITSSESHSPTAFSKRPGVHPVNPNGENKCSALDISPLYQDVGTILNPEGVAVFLIYAKRPEHNRVPQWKSYGKSMQVPFDMSKVEEGSDAIFEKIKMLIGKKR